MDSRNSRLVQSHQTPVTYRLMRAILRFGVRLFFPGLRLLHREKLDHPGPAILVITHPRNLLVALLLVATLDRPVRCLLPAGRIKGAFRNLVCWALRIQAFESLSEQRDFLINECLSVLAIGGLIAVFAESFSQNGGSRAVISDFVARLALEATLEAERQIQPALYPIHWSLGEQRRKSEPLAYVEGPIQAHHFLPKVGEDVAEASRNLAETVQKTIGVNIFGLVEPELERFCREMEDFSREHLHQQWSHRPDWKQHPEELHLSSVARRWISEQNRTDPARLVELRESLRTYHEERRRFAMRRLIIEISGPWQNSHLRLAEAWAETLLGFAVALYGLINHLPPGIVLARSGYLKSSPQRDPKAEWLVRLLVVLSFYTIQVFLVHFWWGRAAAGYYLLTLPVSGAYLWRYRWLLHNRTRVLLLKALQPARSAHLLKKRQEILGKYTWELERSIRPAAMAYGPSPDLAE